MPPSSAPDPSLDIDALDFGALAAERERSLAQVFLRTSKFDLLGSRRSRKVALLGNRGVGKSAALTMLGDLAESNGSIVLRLSPEDYSYEQLNDLLAKEAAGAWAKQGAYTAAWKHLLYVSAMKAALDRRPGLRTGASMRIYNFVRDNYGGLSGNPIGSLVSFLKRLESIKVGKLEAAAKARELQRLYALEELNSLLDDLEEFCLERPVLILVDELDKGWDASEDAIAFVAGLFQAGSAVSLRTPSVRVVMTLRRELFENIPSLNDDAQKLRDAVEMLDWSAKELLAMIAKRIRFSLQLAPDTTNQDAWATVMPKTIWGAPSFDAILEMTLWRPRELIHVCSLALEVARNAERSLPFSETDIDEAVAQYARERSSDLVAEYRFQFPGMMSLIETFRNGKTILTRDELEYHCLLLCAGDLKVDPDARWCLDKQPTELINILWRIGFLRAQLPSADLQHLFIGVFQTRSANINNSTRFRVHEVFERYLGTQPVRAP